MSSVHQWHIHLSSGERIGVQSEQTIVQMADILRGYETFQVRYQDGSTVEVPIASIEKLTCDLPEGQVSVSVKKQNKADRLDWLWESARGEE